MRAIPDISYKHIRYMILFGMGTIPEHIQQIYSSGELMQTIANSKRAWG